ncbi:hypothetical protein MYCTH_2304462 [Thermothelomyces thermophilus ATCC 42464]|uniref:Uncharacterized protein n=1 Tax=Thermothelomyces thermophilus (strain ATCC 42464 / BCRC 31852 / DSM 1799) TaxID=573729 RepID=G2QEN2_THET4|nr:uncharacterized protein MYCTH_2304462 [Thermothelomyces thermophilus ATCC 42464]AEO57815.1 hypothetical protein MYCTH_2304462 [Thermothelomyces thermophilus ATCC 42464]
MSSQNPSTPVKVPSSAANYTAATQDQDLRSQINALLIKEGHVSKIQESLLHALHAHQSNWPSVIQAHALSLLRSGEVTSFPALMRRVLEDVRQDTALGPSANNTNGNSRPATNGATEENGTPLANGKKADSNGSNGAAARQSLAVPQTVVDEALRITRECLDLVCEIDETGAT